MLQQLNPNQNQQVVKIDFSALPCYVDIRKAAMMPFNVRYDFANTMYMQGSGVAMGSLAMKIYNGKGEQEFDANECAIILDFASRINPMLRDSLQSAIDGQLQNQQQGTVK